MKKTVARQIGHEQRELHVTDGCRWRKTENGYKPRRDEAAVKAAGMDAETGNETESG